VGPVRGAAAALAATAAWILVTRRVPLPRFARPALPPAGVVAASAATGITTGVLALGVLTIPAPAAALGLLAAAIPWAVAASRRRTVVEAVTDSWPDVLARVRARVSAGSTLPAAFIDATATAPDPLATASGRIADAVAYGAGFDAALRQLRDELADPIADRVLVTIIAAHRSGGRRVGAVLSTLAASVADELRLRKAHEAALTEQRLTAAVALVAPWGLLALTLATNPQARAAYETAAGTWIIAIGMVATGAGFLLARRTARLSKMPRVFR